MLLLKKKKKTHTQPEANSIPAPHISVAKFLSVDCCRQTEVEITMKTVIQDGSLAFLYNITMLLSKVFLPIFNRLITAWPNFHSIIKSGAMGN